MAQQEIDAALITCNVNLIYTYGRVVSGYLYLPLNAPARLFIKRPNNIEGEHIYPIRKPEQLTDLLKECGLPLPTKLMLEGDELSYTEYTRLAACFPETTVVNGTPIIRKARSIKTDIEIEMFRRSGAAHAKAYERIPSVLQPGRSLMVDMGGNSNGYMGDMSRVFSIGKLPERAYAAHQTCLEIQEAVTEKAKPGAVCEDLYNTAIDMVTKAGFSDYFMGAGQKAKFIGHGIGLEINEAPVLAPRMKQELEPGMVFALEPKIVLPGIGPLGIENSWAVTADGVEKLTLCKEEIIEM